MAAISNSDYEAARSAVVNGHLVVVVWGLGAKAHLAVPGKKHTRTLCGKFPYFPNFLTDGLSADMCQKCMVSFRTKDTKEKKHSKLFAVHGFQGDSQHPTHTSLYHDRGFQYQAAELPVNDGPQGPKHEIKTFSLFGKVYDIEWLD